MNKQTDREAQYRGVIDALTRILKAEGVMGFFKGMKIKMMQTVGSMSPWDAEYVSRRSTSHATSPTCTVCTTVPYFETLVLLLQVLAAALLMSIKEQVFLGTRSLLLPRPPLPSELK